MILLKECCFIFTQPRPIRHHSDSHSKSSSLVINIHRRRKTKTVQCLRSCELLDFHQQLIPYELAWSLQKDIVKQKKSQIQNEGDCNDTLIVLQHPSVFTLGTASSNDNLNFDIQNPPFDIHRTERGGEVTYHGPGQLVMYPIINLRKHKMDLHWYMRKLEEVVIRVMSSTFSIQASRMEGLTGVWVGNEKVAAIGIRVAQWITYHGLALNVTTDLNPFKWIVPCGIRGRQVGSIKGLLREARSSCNDHGTADFHHLDDDSLIHIAHKSLIEEFSKVFQLEDMDFKEAAKNKIPWDGTISVNDFSLSASTFSDKWKMFNPSFPPWLWTAISKHHLGPPKVEGYLSLENVCRVKSSEEEESNISLTCKAESIISRTEEPFDDATLVCPEHEVNHYDFHIVYSPSYRVPVLYFRSYHSDGQPLPISEIEKDLPGHSAELLLESKWTFITQDEHPYLNRPWYKLHPCGTSEWMKLLFHGDTSSNKNFIEQYLVSWFSVVGQVVGLKTPLAMLDNIVSNDS